MIDQQYHRHLPHQVPKDRPLFLTWNLKGAISKALVEKLANEKTRLAGEPLKAGENDAERKNRHS